MKVLIISLCQLKIHENEFVRPIEYVLKELNLKYQIVNYKDLDNFNFESFDKIIISGTALKDFDYLNYLDSFNFILRYENVFGICGGAQIIAKKFGVDLIEKEEIGMVDMIAVREDLGLKKEDKLSCYCLHNYSFDEANLKNRFDILIESEKCVELIKVRNKKIYASLFHPEVRNHQILINFFSENIYKCKLI